MEESDNIIKEENTALINEEEKEKENKENKSEIINEEIIKENDNIVNKKNNENVMINEGIINTDLNLVINPDTENQNKKQIYDYLITIQYSKILHIPYFYFGNIFHFYFPCQSFPFNQIKLSELSTPPFAVIRTECKNII